MYSEVSLSTVTAILELFVVIAHSTNSVLLCDFHRRQSKYMRYYILN